MSTISTAPFDINAFWEKTPKALKYLLIIALIVAGSYYLFSKTISIAQIKQLEKIEQSITTTYTLIDQFQEFEATQYTYNKQTLVYLTNIYALVEELNTNTNRKFDMILKSGGSNTNQIIEKIMLLNESFEKLQKAYTPTDELKLPDISTDISKKKLIEPDIEITRIPGSAMIKEGNMKMPAGMTKEQKEIWERKRDSVNSINKIKNK